MTLPDREYEWPDQLVGFWDQVETLDISDYEKMTVIDAANELFAIAYVNAGMTAGEREGFRAEFFDLMNDYAIDVEDFPWDEWRPWYLGL